KWRASFFRSAETSQSPEYRRRYRNNFLHSNQVRSRDSAVRLGIKSVLNGGTAESSTEIKMLEKEMTGMPVWQAAIPTHGVPLEVSKRSGQSWRVARSTSPSHKSSHVPRKRSRNSAMP